MNNWLQDKNVSLRALEPEDLELLYTIENYPENWFVGSSTPPYSRYALKQYIAAQPRDIYDSGEMRLAICAPDGHAVGLLDLINIDPYNLKAEVGIALLAEERGKGYARASLRLLEGFARENLHLHLLYAYVSRTNNPESRNLFTKAGYAESAVLPEWHRRGPAHEDVSVFCKLLSKKSAKELDG